MTINDWLVSATDELTAAGISSARLDCLILLEDLLGKDRSWLLAHPEEPISQKTAKILSVLVKQRASHIPLAYIRHKTEFYGRNFYVDETVLEPRPESETIIDILKSLQLPPTPVVLDVGTGSGALAISAKLELPHATVHAIDNDHGCLTVASYNARTLGADITVEYGDLLQNFAAPVDVILANLPYVPDNFTLNQAAMNEPRTAIFGGPDGLDLYRTMFKQTGKMPHKPTHILAESLPPQHPALADIASAAGYTQQQEADFIQHFSVA